MRLRQEPRWTLTGKATPTRTIPTLRATRTANSSLESVGDPALPLRHQRTGEAVINMPPQFAANAHEVGLRSLRSGRHADAGSSEFTLQAAYRRHLFIANTSSCRGFSSRIGFQCVSDTSCVYRQTDRQTERDTDRDTAIFGQETETETEVLGALPVACHLLCVASLCHNCFFGS